MFVIALSCGVNHSLAQVLDGIESVEYDAANDRWLVSSSSGVLYTEDHGETFQNLGMAQASHAMEIVDGYLYTLDNNILRGYELTSGLQTSSLNLSASFANGMGSRSGEIFVSDFSAGAIFRINVSDPNNLFISDTAENIGFFPNGLVVDDALNRLVIVGWGNNAPIASMDLDTFEISYEETTTLNYLDGIDIDEWGYFFVSSWGPPKITRFDDNFQPTLADLFEGPEIANPGDISYSISQQKIGIPSTGNNSLVFLDIWGCTDEEACNFNEFAWKLDNSCLYGDDCGPCDGNALPDGACDCDGNTPIAGYDCNGDCLSDENQNGVCDFLELEEIQSQIENGGFCGEGTIWDDVSQTCIIDELFCGWQPDGDGDMLIGVSDLLMLLAVFGDTDLDQDGIFDSADDCVGAYDECGVCNGDGPSIPVIESIEVLYDSVYAEAIDEWWVFEIGTDTTFTLLCELYGCTDPTAENFNEEATNDDGSCLPYVGQVAFGGLVIAINEDNAQVLNIHEEVESGTLAEDVDEAVATLITNGYDDWHLPSSAQMADIIVPNQGFINSIASSNDGLTLDGWYVTSWYAHGDFVYSAYFFPGDWSPCNGVDCYNVPGKVRAVRTHSIN